MKEAMKRVTRRELERHGQQVNVVLKTQTDVGEYGETFDETVETVAARVTSSTEMTPSRSHREAGDISTDIDVFVADTISGVTDGGGEGATEVDLDRSGDPRYVVLLLHNQDNGLLRLGCERL